MDDAAAHKKNVEMFRKRKDSLLRKVHDLTTLTGADAVILLRFRKKLIAYNNNRGDGWSSVEQVRQIGQMLSPSDFLNMEKPSKIKRRSNVGYDRESPKPDQIFSIALDAHQPTIISRHAKSSMTMDALPDTAQKNHVVGNMCPAQEPHLSPGPSITAFDAGPQPLDCSQALLNTGAPLPRAEKPPLSIGGASDYTTQATGTPCKHPLQLSEELSRILPLPKECGSHEQPSNLGPEPEFVSLVGVSPSSRGQERSETELLSINDTVVQQREHKQSRMAAQNTHPFVSAYLGQGELPPASVLRHAFRPASKQEEASQVQVQGQCQCQSQSPVCQKDLSQSNHGQESPIHRRRINTTEHGKNARKVLPTDRQTRSQTKRRLESKRQRRIRQRG